MASKLINRNVLDREVILARGRSVINDEAEALKKLSQMLDDSFSAACEMILASPRRVIVTGMGKSGHIARKIAATFSATGTPAHYIHPAEAAHGDLGMMAKGDTLIVLSKSGNTTELVPMIEYAHKLGIPIIGITSRSPSLLSDKADIHLALPAMREACAIDVAPTTSTALQLALGDALAMAVMDSRGVNSDSLRALHPGGAIGLRLTPVRAIMHGRERLPMVDSASSLRDTIFAMNGGGFGIVGVKDDAGNLIGVITDGDIRRHFDTLFESTAEDIMTRSPKTISVDMLAEDALLFLNESKITAAFVMERRNSAAPGRPVGIVHIHDFIRLGVG